MPRDGVQALETVGEGCIFGHNNNLKDTAHLHFLRILFEVINFMWNCHKLTRLRVSSFQVVSWCCGHQ